MAAIVWNTPTRWWQGKLFDYADGIGLAAVTRVKITILPLFGPVPRLGVIK